MRKKVLSIGLMSLALVTGAAVTLKNVEASVLEKLFAPKAKLWAVWSKHDPDSQLGIDHSVWTDILSAHVEQSSDGINRVNYGGISETGRAKLTGYLEKLQSIPISDYPRDEQFVYWVNLYNALTVDVILRHYPVASIRDIKLSKGIFSSGPWSKKLVAVEGKEVSLNDIEHRILRPIWKDPRIHYAVNCASLGCPNLMLQAFDSDNTEALLEQAAHAYVNHPRGARVEDGALHVSSIYVWFEADFGDGEEGVIGHLRRYADGELADALQGIDGISGNGYDWSLNEL